MGAIPLRRWRILRTSDLKITQEYLTLLFCNLRFTVAEPTRIDAEVNSRHFSETSITALSFGTESDIDLGDSREFFGVIVPLTGTALVKVSETDIVANDRTGVILSTTGHASVHVDSGAALLVVRIGRCALELALAELLHARLRHPVTFAPDLHFTHGAGLLIRAMLDHVVSELDRSGTLVDRPSYWDAWEKALVRALLLCHPHNYADALMDKNDPHPPPLQKVLGVIEARPELAHRMDRLCQITGTGPRTVQRLMRTRLGTNFRDHLRDIRLKRIHDQLRTLAPNQVTVADIVKRWGAFYNGRLLNAYRSRYERGPADTLST